MNISLSDIFDLNLISKLPMTFDMMVDREINADYIHWHNINMKKLFGSVITNKSVVPMRLFFDNKGKYSNERP